MKLFQEYQLSAARPVGFLEPRSEPSGRGQNPRALPSFGQFLR